MQYSEMKPIFMNNTLGDSVDSKEREEYNLFQGVDGFIVARLYALPNGGYETRMVTTGGGLKAIMADPSGIEMLRDYLEHHEEIKGNRAPFEKRWSIVTYDGMGQPITKGEIEKAGNPVEATCGVGGCCLGLGVGGYVGYGMWQPEGDAYNVTTVCFVVPSGMVGAWAGCEIGKRVDRIKAIQAIKEARKPHAVE
jgi:hypothetical protein